MSVEECLAAAFFMHIQFTCVNLDQSWSKLSFVGGSAPASPYTL